MPQSFMFPSIFFHLLFSKKHLVVIAFFMFCCFCAGWMVVVAKFLLDGSGHLTYPESFFLLGDIPHSGIKKGGTGKKCLIWLPLFFHIFRFSFHLSPISFLYLNLSYRVFSRNWSPHVSSGCFRSDALARTLVSSIVAESGQIA